MTVSYSGLWKMLQENGLRKQNLVDDVGLSPVTVSKMGKGKMVNDKIIDRVCEYLNCRPRDIIELEQYNNLKTIGWNHKTWNECNAAKREDKTKNRDMNCKSSVQF